MKFRNERGHNTSLKEWVNIMVIGSKRGLKTGDSGKPRKGMSAQDTG
jgi:hypothetical protein